MEILKENLYKKYKLEGLLDNKKLYKEKHNDFIEIGTIEEDFKRRFNISSKEINEIKKNIQIYL